MKYEYIPKGVCSRKMIFDINDNVLTNLQIVGGCNGNAKGISALVEGMDIKDIIKRLDGITCGGKTSSCPGQLARALKDIAE